MGGLKPQERTCLGGGKQKGEEHIVTPSVHKDYRFNRTMKIPKSKTEKSSRAQFLEGSLTTKVMPQCMGMRMASRHQENGSKEKTPSETNRSCLHNEQKTKCLSSAAPGSKPKTLFKPDEPSPYL